MKRIVPVVMAVALVAALGVGVRCFSPPAGHAQFWPGMLADEVGRNTVLSEPQQRIQDVVKAVGEHKLDDLIKQYRKEVTSEPDSAVAHFAIGYACHVQMAYVPPKSGQSCCESGMVERELQQAIKLSPHLEEAYVTLGAYYVDQSPVKAVAFLTQYLEQSPDDAEAMYWIAMAYGTRAGVVEGSGVTAQDRARYASRYCYDENKMIEWLRKAEQACPGWLLPHSFLESKYVQLARRESKTGGATYAEPWKGLAIEECRTILKLASPTRDSELRARIKSRLDQLTRE